MGRIEADVLHLLERLLDVAARRQTLLSSNIANVDTPGYRTRDLDFERAMRAASGAADRGAMRLERTSPRHLGDASVPERSFEFEPAGLARRNDLNNVSIDREMLELARTSGRYNTAIEILRKRFALLRYTIQDGRSG